jgi:hypothetical protein
MTVKVLGAGSESEDSIGILGDPFSDASGNVSVNVDQDVDELELLEFLAADLDPVPADPAFRRRLSDLLWDMVRDGRVTRHRNH